MDGSPLLAAVAHRDRYAARNLFCRRYDRLLKRARRGSALHSFSLLRKMEFRRTSRASAHSRFCSKRRPRTVDAHGRGGFIFFTPQRVFEANESSWRPLIEVAWIFLGISSAADYLRPEACRLTMTLQCLPG